MSGRVKPREWHDGLSLEDACKCGHDVGSHGSRTSECKACACSAFRPAAKVQRVGEVRREQ